MAKKTWDKAIHAAPTIDHRLTQDIYRKFSPHVPAPASDVPYEPRMYNPSGPFYNTTAPPPPVTPPPDPPIVNASQKETKA